MLKCMYSNPKKDFPPRLCSRRWISVHAAGSSPRAYWIAFKLTGSNYSLLVLWWSLLLFCLFRALAAASNGRLVNDLEAPAFSLSPLLLRLKQDILQYENAVSGVMMYVDFAAATIYGATIAYWINFDIFLWTRSGSGTSVFALRDKSNPNPFPAEEISQRFPGLRHFKCSFVSRANDLISWY